MFLHYRHKHGTFYHRQSIPKIDQPRFPHCISHLSCIQGLLGLGACLSQAAEEARGDVSHELGGHEPTTRLCELSHVRRNGWGMVGYANLQDGALCSRWKGEASDWQQVGFQWLGLGSQLRQLRQLPTCKE